MRDNCEARTMKGVIVIALLQIFLLVNLTPANSYFLSSHTSFDSFFIEEKIENLISNTGKFLISLFSIKQIGSVSAEIVEELDNPIFSGKYKAKYNTFFGNENGLHCCVKMNNGARCQNVPPEFDNCEGELILTLCTYVSSCGNVGCCVEEETGFCYPNSAETMCLENEGVFETDATCSFSSCESGCCIIGNEIYWVNSNTCNKLSLEKGFGFVNFSQHKTQTECLKMKENQKTGACLLGYRDDNFSVCRFGSEIECLQWKGLFYENYLCSNEELNSGCAKQVSTGCVEGKDEIYWFDSCGNRENIYSSNKDFSWNEGKVLEKKDSCNPSLANINSEDCGNCNRLKGSSCSNVGLIGTKIKDGSYVCENLNCLDENGKIRINGESWCSYDGFIGEGKDVVGSRSWRKICVDGEIKTEGCSDFRNELCAEKISNEDGIEKSVAVCRTNRWKNCLAISASEESDMPEGRTKQELCEEDSDCKWESVKIGDSTNYFCLPEYPPGLKFWDDGTSNSLNSFGGTVKQDSVSAAEQQCSIATQTCTVVEVKESRWSSWKCVANCDCREEIFTQEMNEFCISLGDCGSYVNIEGELTTEGSSILGKNSKQLSLSYLNSLKKYKEEGANIKIPFSNSTSYGYNSWERQNYQGTGDYEKLWTNKLQNLWIGGLLIPLGPLIFFFSLFDLILGGNFGGEIIKWALGGDTRKYAITFTCLPWSPPTKNQKCESCDDDLSKSCTEYRCKSLGASCMLENANTENPICYESNPNDVSPPILAINKISKGYKFISGERGAQIKTEENSCIPEFTPVIISLNTNEYARCRVAYEHTNNILNMSTYLGGTNIFRQNHSFTYIIPSLSSLQVYDIEGNIREKFGKLDMYIRCEDTHGNVNIEEFDLEFCIKSGPDETPAVIIASDPNNGSYLQFGFSEISSTFYLMEPAECRWDINSNRTYNEMGKQMDCVTDLEGITITENGSTEIGWTCKANLSGLENNKENKIYIRCLDQPWYKGTENESLRNENAQSYEYVLKGSSGVLEITNIYPENGQEISVGTITASISLKAETSGGSENGKAVCRFYFENENWGGQFFNTNAKNHEQPSWNLNSGDYILKVSCIDSAGNRAEKISTFKILQDINPPKVVRLYNEDGKLVVYTNEPARCTYSESSCFFDLKNGTSMTTGYSISHNAEWNSEKRYYIRCEDVFENIEGGCSILASPFLY